MAWLYASASLASELTEPTTLDQAKTVADIIGTLVTAIAVIVGGSWAYFKFIKGRTFRPHGEVRVDGSWLGPNGAKGIHLVVRLRNIGTGKLELVQRGTGVKVSQIADQQPAAPAVTVWKDVGVFEIFTKHEWIEPGETVEDDLLIRLAIEPQVLEVQTRVVLAWKPQNLTIDARRVIVPPVPGRTTTDGVGH